MECSERLGDGSPPHERGTATDTRWSQEGHNRESIARNRFWGMRPDDIASRLPTETKEGVFFILEFKRMSDVRINIS